MEKKNYPAIYRIMHWMIAICMTLLFITIFLRLGWMNKGDMATIIETSAKTNHPTFTSGEATAIARSIRYPMWIWHIYIGYVLVGLFSIRFMLPFFRQMKFQYPCKNGLSTKQRFQYWIYLVFYACVTTSLVTGLFLEFGPESLEHMMEDIHVLSIYYLLAYIILHIGGVLIAELTNDQGLVSRIISGGKKEGENIT